jgi:hypothetical protein
MFEGMSLPADHHDIAALSNAALSALLKEAEREERGLSDRRQELHDLIDADHGDPDSSPGLEFEISALARREREVSTRRLELHRRITELRLEKNRRVNGIRASLHAVDTNGA